MNSLDASFDEKLDLINAVDEYVFGFALLERSSLTRATNSSAMMGYVGSLLAEGDFPALSAVADDMGFEAVWSEIDRHGHDTGRFDRNLARLLAGFQASL